MTFRDPLMLLSLLNTKLRDRYESLDDLCYDEALDKKELIEFFEQNNIYFDEENRQFKQKWALWLTFLLIFSFTVIHYIKKNISHFGCGFFHSSC